jgi:small GTP-binding protein
MKKKLCMLGASGVGKTSLVARFVRSAFSDKYLTTIGVKVDKKTVTINGVDCDLMLWDLAGEDEFVTAQLSYLRNAHGYLLVVDGTRRATLDAAMLLHGRAGEVVGEVPFLLLFNKRDLADGWEVSDAQVQSLAERGWKVLRTSAKSGAGVETAFHQLAVAMIGDA